MAESKTEVERVKPLDSSREFRFLFGDWSDDSASSLLIGQMTLRHVHGAKTLPGGRRPTCGEFALFSELF